MKRNQVYRLKNAPHFRLIFWRKVFNKEQGTFLYFFVKAPMPGENIGKARGNWLHPDDDCVYCYEVGDWMGAIPDIEEVVEITDTLPHEVVNLIPYPLPGGAKLNLP